VWADIFSSFITCEAAALAQKTQYSARTLCVQPTFIAKYESLWDLVCSIAYLPFPERAYTDLV